MSIYTKTGDAGETGLFGNRRVRKHDPRIEAYGTVDELNSALGVVAAQAQPELAARLAQIQSTLFDIGADLATDGGKRSVPRVESHTRQLEGWIEAAAAALVHPAGRLRARRPPAPRADGLSARRAPGVGVGRRGGDGAARAPGLPEPALRPVVRLGPCSQPGHRLRRRAMVRRPSGRGLSLT